VEIKSGRAVVVIEAVPKPPPWLADVLMPLDRGTDAKQPVCPGSGSSSMPPRDGGNVSTITHNNMDVPTVSHDGKRVLRNSISLCQVVPFRAFEADREISDDDGQAT
jgi:hypothetical protein